MKIRNTLILLGVAVGLVLFIVIFERGTTTSEEALDLRQRAFPELKGRTGEATAIEIVRGSEKVVLVKREAGTDDEYWQITQPVDYRADKMRVEGFLGAFEDAKKTAIDAEGGLEIPLGPADPVSEYKLDAESAAQVAILAGKDKLLDALVGTRTASKDRAYVARATREAVYVVGDVVSDEARRMVDEFRDKRLLTLKSRGAVSGLTLLEADQPKAVLSREKGKPWHLVAPVGDRAAQDKVNSIVDRMDSLWADAFVADISPDDAGWADRMAEYGLAVPQKSVRISVEVGGEVREHTVKFGKKIKKQETGSSPSEDVYAMVSGSRTVTLVPAGSLDALDVTVDELRDHSVVDFETSDAVTVSFNRFPGEVRLEKKDDDWRMAAPEDVAADETTVEDLLDALRDLKVEKFLPEGTELKTPVRVEVTWRRKGEEDSSDEEEGDKEAESETELAFFERGEGDTIRARRGEKGAVFEVQRAILEELTASPLHFRDRRVLEFDQSKLTGIAVTVDGKAASAARDGDTWKLEGEGEVDALRADRMKWDLSELEAAEFVGKATDAELGRYGLGPAAVRVELTLKPEEEDKPGKTHVLLVGAAKDPDAGEDERKYFARLEDDPMVFLLEAKDLKDVRAGLVKIPAEEAPPNATEAGDGPSEGDAAGAE